MIFRKFYCILQFYYSLPFYLFITTLSTSISTFYYSFYVYFYYYLFLLETKIDDP